MSEEFKVHKISHWVPISREMAMEYGLIPDTREPVVTPRRVRAKWWIGDRVRKARHAVGFWIAGVDPEAYE